MARNTKEENAELMLKLDGTTKDCEEHIEVDFDKIIQSDYKLAENILSNPDKFIPLIDDCINDIPGTDKEIRFINLPKSTLIPIRQLRSKHLNQFITIEGIIRQASDVRPVMVRKTFECVSCGLLLTTTDADPKIKCVCGNKHKGAFRATKEEFRDQQPIVIEEVPELLDTLGAQPKKIHVMLEGTLADPKLEKRAIPGTKVKVLGVLKQVDMNYKGILENRREIIIRANNIVPSQEDFDELDINETDITQIKTLSQNQDVFDIMAKSLAPSIYGYEPIKRAIILQLFGGVRTKKSDNSFFRGDTHILICGDPGTAKSVLIRNAAGLLPRARYVSGKSASGAGLTGTFTKDELTGQWTIEAGAMPLANGSMIVTDELDKMNENDRSHLHEALEQQSISFAKAGINRTLQTQACLLAAANPKLGKFDPANEDNVLKDINLSPALLSRFDCIFIIRDTISEQNDGMIADRILGEHDLQTNLDLLPHDFMKKYFVYARKINPKLTKECHEHIKRFYLDIRMKGKDKNVIQMTARQLEGIIRLTQAHARMRLSDTTSIQDAEVAIALMKETLSQTGLRADGLLDPYSILKIPQSQIGKVKAVKAVITAAHANGKTPIHFTNLIEQLNGLTEDEIYKSLDTLKKSADIFEPKRNWYSKT